MLNELIGMKSDGLCPPVPFGIPKEEFVGVWKSTWNFHMPRELELNNATKKFGVPKGGKVVPSKSDGSIPKPFAPLPVGRTSKQISSGVGLPANIAVRS